MIERKEAYEVMRASMKRGIDLEHGNIIPSFEDVSDVLETIEGLRAVARAANALFEKDDDRVAIHLSFVNNRVEIKGGKRMILKLDDALAALPAWLLEE